jgi:hypothetical protein
MQAGRAQVLVDAEGRVLAAILRRGPRPPDGNERFVAEDVAPEIDIVPDDGQSVHDVDLPDELLGETGVDLAALADYRFEPGREGRWARR